MSIHDKLPLFAKEDVVYKQLIGDPSRPILIPETNINDYNSGSIENALRWHMEYQKRIVTESTLSLATGSNLDIWGKFYGILRPVGMSDSDYIILIVSTVTAAIATYPIIFRELNNPPDSYVYKKLGFFCDYSCLDTGVLNPANINPNRSSILATNKAIYVLVSSLSVISNSILIKIRNIIAANTSIYIGVFTP